MFTSILSAGCLLVLALANSRIVLVQAEDPGLAQRINSYVFKSHPWRLIGTNLYDLSPVIVWRIQHHQPGDTEPTPCYVEGQVKMVRGVMIVQRRQYVPREMEVPVVRHNSLGRAYVGVGREDVGGQVYDDGKPVVLVGCPPEAIRNGEVALYAVPFGKQRVGTNEYVRLNYGVVFTNSLEGYPSYWRVMSAHSLVRVTNKPSVLGQSTQAQAAQTTFRKE